MKTRGNGIIYRDFTKNKYIYLMAIPVLAFYIIFCYAPMYGVVIAFKDFSPKLGILGSPWVGLEYFKDFFTGRYCWSLIRNTVLISLYDLLWGFPAPIIFALLLNEIKNKFFKSTIQTLTYMPHFVSLVVICGILKDFTATDGVISVLLSYIGIQPSNLLIKPGLFRTIYVSSNIWQNIGWGSIIYLAAITGIDPSQYEAAIIDGAGRWKQILHVTLPGIAPTIIIMLILNIGSMMSVGFEKVILLYNPLTYETADVISSFVYRKGLQEFNYGYSTAVGLFNSVINMVLLVVSNKLSKKFSETSLW